MKAFVVVTIYTPPKGMVVVHSWGPYPDRKTAINAATKMRRRAHGENAWIPNEAQRAAENARLRLSVHGVMDPFEVRERDGEGKLVVVQRSHDLGLGI